MSAPPTLPPWDTNDTNLALSINSGHQTDGYAIGEIPTSTELNLWFQLLSLWINYLQSLASLWSWVPAIKTAATGGALEATGTLTYGSLAGTNLAASAVLPIPIVIPVGKTITGIGVVLNGDGDTVHIDLMRAGPADSPPVSIANFSETGGFSAVGVEYQYAIPATQPIAADGTTYFIRVTADSGNVGAIVIYAVGFATLEHPIV